MGGAYKHVHTMEEKRIHKAHTTEEDGDSNRTAHRTRTGGRLGHQLRAGSQPRSNGTGGSNVLARLVVVVAEEGFGAFFLAPFPGGLHPSVPRG